MNKVQDDVINVSAQLEQVRLDKYHLILKLHKKISFNVKPH